MHWPSFLVGLLVLPTFVVAAALARAIVQYLRRNGYRFTGAPRPIIRGTEPLEFEPKVMGNIHSSGTES